jgi:hypothetical protein
MNIKKYRKKSTTRQYSRSNLEKSTYRHWSLELFETGDGIAGEEVLIEAWDPQYAQLCFDYAQDADDAELLKRHLSLVLERFSRR